MHSKGRASILNSIALMPSLIASLASSGRLSTSARASRVHYSEHWSHSESVLNVSPQIGITADGHHQTYGQPRDTRLTGRRATAKPWNTFVPKCAVRWIWSWLGSDNGMQVSLRSLRSQRTVGVRAQTVHSLSARFPAKHRQWKSSGDQSGAALEARALEQHWNSSGTPLAWEQRLHDSNWHWFRTDNLISALICIQAPLRPTFGRPRPPVTTLTPIRLSEVRLAQVGCDQEMSVV